MEFYTAVFISIFWLSMAAFLGGLIIYFLMQSKHKKSMRELKNLRMDFIKSKEDIQKQKKMMQLEIDARDKKMEYLKADLLKAKDTQPLIDMDSYILKTQCEEHQAVLKENIESLENEVIRLELEIKELKVEKPEKKVSAVKSSLTKEEKKEEALVKIKEKSKSFDFSNIGIADSNHKDDLKIIVGIGPFIEEKLNALGIYTFEQISKFTEQDIENVTEVIEFFPGRIERDDWISQSKELMKKDS